LIGAWARAIVGAIADLLFWMCVLAGTVTGPASAQEASGFREDFQSIEVGEDGVLVSALGRFIVEGDATLEILTPRPWPEGELGLRLPGGDAMGTVIEVAPACAFGGTMEFTCQRDGRKRPFVFTVTLVGRDGVDVVRDLTDQINAKELRSVVVDVPAGLAQVRFSVTAPVRRGVWIDDLRFVPPVPMRLESSEFQPFTRPLIHGEPVQVGFLEVRTSGGLEPLVISEAVVAERVVAASESDAAAPSPLMAGFSLGDGAPSLQLASGINRIPVFVTANLWGTESEAEGTTTATEASWSTPRRYGLALSLGEERLSLDAATEGEIQPALWPAARVLGADVEVDGVSLAAVSRKGESKAVLVAAISTPGGLVLRRSLDGGGTWTGATLSVDASGLREAALTFDLSRGKLHLIAEKDAGLVHATSVDQGATWSEPQVLDALGPKRVGGAGSSGILMSTGELVVPCIVYGGFRIEDEPCAGIVFSRDGGDSWELNQAAFPNTTTSAAVEVGPGALMLNMTDNRGALRSERITRNLGESWIRRNQQALSNLHRSVGSDGALIHLGRARGKGPDRRLVFANAQTERLPMRHMTLKGSSDSASSWPMEHRVLLDDGVGVDHPSLVPVGDAEVGIAYSPSAGGVIFQRLPESVVVPKTASWFDVTGGR
jgi:hypothetical protein